MQPIIATTLSGLFIKSEPWKKAHKMWFERMSEELDDPLIKDYADEEDYFKHVDEIMERAYPELPEKERTIKARTIYFTQVREYITMHPNVVNNEMVEFFNSLKPYYRFGLITNNTRITTDIILSLTGLQGLFSISECSEEDEKDDKNVVFDRFIKFYGKPKMYIGNRKQSFDYCRKNKIPFISVNIEGGNDLPGADAVHNVSELKEMLEKSGIENE